MFRYLRTATRRVATAFIKSIERYGESMVYVDESGIIIAAISTF